MLIHGSSQTKDKAEIKFMAEKTTNMGSDWQQKPEEGLFVCSQMKVGTKIPKASGVEGEGGWKETTELRYSQELDNRTALYFRRGQKRNPLKSDLHKKTEGWGGSPNAGSRFSVHLRALC